MSEAQPTVPQASTRPVSLRDVTRDGADLRLAGHVRLPGVASAAAVRLVRTSSDASLQGSWAAQVKPFGPNALDFEVVLPVDERAQLAGFGLELELEDAGGATQRLQVSSPTTTPSATTPQVLLSVVVPCHDVEEWVEECLESLARQDVESLEVLVVDDRSADGTRAAVERMQERFGAVRLLDSAAPGGGSARNTGIAAARGRYLVFADGDDLVPDGAYRRMVDVLSVTGSDLAVGDFLKFANRQTWSITSRWGLFDRDSLGVTPDEVPEIIRTRACWNKVFRRDTWDAAGIEFPDVPRSNDVVPMTRAYLAARRVDVVGRPVYLYRSRPGGRSMTAQASAAAGTLSYLTQERECLRLVHEQGSEALQRTYGRMVTESDLWVHTVRHLDVVREHGSEGPEVLEAIVGLWHAVPEDVRQQLGRPKRVLMGLLADGREDVVMTLPPAAPHVLGGGEGVLELEEVMDVARALAPECAEDGRLAAVLLGKHLVPALRRLVRDAEDPESPEPASSADPAVLRATLREFVDLFATGLATADLTDEQRAALRAVVAPDDEAAVEVLLAERERVVVPPGSLVVERADEAADHLVLGGTLDLTWTDEHLWHLEVRLNHGKGAYAHVRRAALTPMPGTDRRFRWTARFPQEALTRLGRWTVMAELSFAGSIRRVTPAVPDALLAGTTTRSLVPLAGREVEHAVVAAERRVHVDVARVAPPAPTGLRRVRQAVGRLRSSSR